MADDGHVRNLGDVLAEVATQAMLDKEAELDAEIARLDKVDDEDLDRLRKERIDSMKKHASKRQELQAKGHGEYQEIFGEKEFFEACKASENVAIHFFRSTTWRCQIVDKHFQELCRRHIECRFIKINAEKAPFLCERLRVVMLPTIVLVKNGQTSHSFIGFDEFGDEDDFETELMEEKMAQWQVIKLKS